MTAPMNPADVPHELIEAFERAALMSILHEDVRPIRYILAAVIPAIRAQVADEIAYERDKQIHQDPDLDPEDKLARWIDDVYQRCIRIARGDQ